MNRSTGTGSAARRRASFERRARRWLPLAACFSLAMSGCAGGPPTSARGASAARAPVVLYSQTPRPDELGRLVVPVEINGQGPFYFLLDTGAARSVLTRAVLERLGVSEDKGHDVYIRGVSGRTRVHTAVVDSFRVGDVELRAQRLPVLRAQVLDGLDGILSTERLRDLHLTADFVQAEVRIMDLASAETPAGALPMRSSSAYRQLIIVPARIGRHRVPAIIDTGGAHTLGNMALLNKLIADSGGTLDGVVRSSVTDATDTALATWDSQVETLNIGPVAIDDLRVSFGEFPVFKLWQFDQTPALLIGMDALSQMKSISVDYRHRRMVVAARDLAE